MKDTQIALIVARMMARHVVTPLDALKFAGCMNFSGRISDIRRMGFARFLREKWITIKNQFGKAVRVKGFYFDREDIKLVKLIKV